MAQSYFSLVTTAGKIKLAESAAGGSAVVITHFAVGDGNGAETNPTAASTTLVREVWRTAVESVETDPDNPAAVLVTAIIPTNAGGWWMREFGIFANDGTMIAVAKPVSQYKPTALEGQLEDIRYEFQIIIGESANVTLLVDPSLVFATREWVATRRIPMAQLMRVPWLPVISMTLSSAPGSPALGDTYLVPANATGVWAANIGKLAEWSGTAWSYATPPNGHGISLPDGRVMERVGGSYVEKLALDTQSGKWQYAVAVGTPNALAIVLDPAPAALMPGMIFRVLASATNTSTVVTLTVNGLGPISVIGGNGQPPRIGDILGGRITTFVYDGTYAQIVGSAQIGLRNIVVFDTPGTTSWVVPTNVTRVRVVCIGGGAAAGKHSDYPGAGGGSGGRATKWCDVTPGASISITVGAGGAAPASPANGNNGGTSSFGAFCSATGGGGGQGGTGSVGGPGNTTAGGSPGQGIGGDINEYGSYGNDGIGNNLQGGSGGGPGNGRGASGFSTGVSAASYGGGGGGGGSNTTTSGGASGGAGYKGCVIVEY